MKHSKDIQHYALDIQGNLIEVDEADKSFEYRCPGCGEIMIPRKGAHNRHHFAHKQGSACEDYDGYLHSVAEIKICEWLNRSEHIDLLLPKKIQCQEYGHCRWKCSECIQRSEQKFDLKNYYRTFTTECVYGNYRADIASFYKDKPIFIEVYVTHQCEQNKIDSGIRIIEFKIENEDDIKLITQSDFISPGDKVKLYGFKKIIEYSDSAEIKLDKFILFRSGKGVYLTDEFTCKNFSRRKGLYELTLSKHGLEYDIPIFLPEVGLMGALSARAYSSGIDFRNCTICRSRVWNDYHNDYICMRYKSCYKPPLCKDNDARQCRQFQVDSNKISKALMAYEDFVYGKVLDEWMSK